MTINVLDLRDTSEIGGPGKTILETAKQLNHNRFKNYIAVFQTRNEIEDSEFIKKAKEMGLLFHVIKSYNQYDPTIIFKLYKLINKYNIHILHTHEPKSDIVGYIVRKLCNVILISTIHGWINNSKRDQFYNKIDKFILRKFDKVIVVSNLMKKQMHKTGISSDKLILLYNSIVTKKYKNNGKTNILEKITQKKLNSPIIATIGRLNPEKGHIDFINAAGTIISKGYNASFVLVGDGIEKGKLQKRVKELGLESKIFFTGYLQNITDVYNDIDLLVLPSYTEGLPNVVLESLMMHVPVVATAVGGTPEIIEHNKTGILVKPNSPGKLADSIIYFIKSKDDFKQMAYEGKDNVKNKFDFKQRIKKIENLYETLINVKRN